MDEINSYFREQTNTRLISIETKVDLILSKYWMLVGMASAISTIAGATVSIAIHFILK